MSAIRKAVLLSMAATNDTMNDTMNEVPKSENGSDILLTIVGIIGLVVVLYSLTIARKLIDKISLIFVDIFMGVISFNLFLVVALVISFTIPADQNNCIIKMIITRALFSSVHTTFAITSYLRNKSLVDPVSVYQMDKPKVRRNVIIVIFIDTVLNIVTSMLDQRHIFVLQCANMEFEDDDSFHTIPRVVFFIIRTGVLLTSSYFDYLTVNIIIEKKKTHMKRFSKVYLASYKFPILTGLLPPLSCAIMFILVGIAGILTNWQNIHTDLMSAGIIHSSLLIGLLVLGTFLCKKTTEEQRTALKQRNQFELRIEQARYPNPTRRHRALDLKLEELHHPPEENFEVYVLPIKDVLPQQNQVDIQVEIHHQAIEIFETDEFRLKIQSFLDEIALFSFIDDDEVEEILD